MKKIISIILALTAVMSGCTTLAEEKIKVTLDGQAMDFDVAPIIAVLIIPILTAGKL